MKYFEYLILVRDELKWALPRRLFICTTNDAVYGRIWSRAYPSHNTEALEFCRKLRGEVAKYLRGNPTFDGLVSHRKRNSYANKVFRRMSHPCAPGETNSEYAAFMIRFRLKFLGQLICEARSKELE